MKTIWFRGIKPEDQKDFEAQVKQSKKVLDKLHEIVYNMLKERESVAPTDYNCSSWPYLQAHQNGAAEMARRIMEILEIEPPK